MRLKSILEAILFVHGEPISYNELAHLTEQTEDEVSMAIQELTSDYGNDQDSRGLVMIEKDDRVQIGSHPDAHAYVEKLIKSEFTENLSRSGLETLAIVAYKGPLSRPEIDYIRGVNSSFTLRNLLMRGLIERTPHPHDARAYRYEISFQFLQHFGLAKLDKLPEYESLRKEVIEIAEEKTAGQELQDTN
mgnify:FL=1